nr:alpha/beta hydrolase-fold protein [Candidatus Brocadiia bacterium]
MTTHPARAYLLPALAAAALALCASPSPGQAPASPAASAPAFEQRFGAAAQAVTAKLRAMPRKAACADSGLARALLSLEKAAILHQSRSAFASPKGDADAELAIAESWVKSPKPAEPADWRGFHELAFISPLDLSAQPCLLYVPSTFDGKTPLPLLIFLHGYAGDLNKVNWRDYMYSPSLQAVCEELGYALLLPFARGNTEFMGVGEEDVLYALNLVKQRIPVDESRVVMSGASMGGSGAYSIACHYPHLFSGVFTVTGRVDYYLWMKKDKSSFPPFKQFWLDNDYARELL